MLQKAKDYITWGDASSSTVESMLSNRGRMSGDKPLTDDIVARIKRLQEYQRPCKGHH